MADGTQFPKPRQVLPPGFFIAPVPGPTAGPRPHPRLANPVRDATAMSAALASWDDGNGFPRIRAAWLRDATPPGTPISVHAGNDRIEGTFAGIDNDLFYNEKTAMVFGDAKSTVQDIVTELGNL